MTRTAARVFLVGYTAGVASVFVFGLTGTGQRVAELASGRWVSELSEDANLSWDSPPQSHAPQGGHARVRTDNGDGGAFVSARNTVAFKVQSTTAPVVTAKDVTSMDLERVVAMATATELVSNKRSIIAIPITVGVDCSETNLPDETVRKLLRRRIAMDAQLKKNGIPFRPVEFCNMESLDAPRPECAKLLGKRKHNSTKDINIAHHFRDALLACARSNVDVCLVMEDDTKLHPEFARELGKLLDTLPDDWGLVHLFLSDFYNFSHFNKGPWFFRRTIPESTPRNWTLDFRPAPRAFKRLARNCKNLGCDEKLQRCTLPSLQERFFLDPGHGDERWGDGKGLPCVTYMGAPLAFAVRPVEAHFVAEEVFTKVWCGSKTAPVDLQLGYLGRRRHHYSARDPQLCYDDGGPGGTTFSV